MKAYKIVLLVVDNEEQGEEGIKEELSRCRYSCPTVMSCEEADIGEWSDDHPLNKHATHEAEFARLFQKGKGQNKDFQTAPYETLCGCVSALIPRHMQHIWKENVPNHVATEHLIRNAVGNRVVLSDCPKCGGTGITPNQGSKNNERN